MIQPATMLPMDFWIIEDWFWSHLSWSKGFEHFIVFLEQCVNNRGDLASEPTNHFALASIALLAYSECTFPVVDGRTLTPISFSPSRSCSVSEEHAMRRYILTQAIRWEFYPLVAQHQEARQWLEIQ